MQFKQKLVYVALGVLLVLAGQFTLYLVTNATADQHETASPTVKYVLTVNYPLGKKAEYLDWIKSIADHYSVPIRFGLCMG